MPDYQTAEGMAVEPYNIEITKLRKALKRVKRIIVDNYDVKKLGKHDVEGMIYATVMKALQ